VTGDIREQLAAALDTVEGNARKHTTDPGYAWHPPTRSRGEWNLRLVAYFREELSEIDAALRDDADDEAAQGRLQRAAAFWLGTPEADR
jgi:hypothetical protein